MSSTIIAIASLAIAAAEAVQPAETAPLPTGSIVAASEVEGSVLVIRGSGVYTLAQGDAVFAGDKVFTRDNGAVTVAAHGCSQSLGASSSVIVSEAFCEEAPVALDGSGEVAGVELASASQLEDGEVGAFGSAFNTRGVTFGRPVFGQTGFTNGNGRALFGGGQAFPLPRLVIKPIGRPVSGPPPRGRGPVGNPPRGRGPDGNGPPGRD